MKALALKRTICTGSFCLAIFLSPLKGRALTIQEVPNPRQVNGGWVTDMAEILADDTEAQLNEMIAELERQNGTEIAVVTVPETAPSASVKEFTTKLFNYWGIGKKEQDNGVLFLISKGDRRVEIETGYGIEDILPNAKVGEIINTQIIPQFKQGNFDGGTLAGTKALVVTLESSLDKKPTPTAIESETPKTILVTPLPSPLQEPTQDVGVPWGLLIGGSGLALAIATAAYVRHRGRLVVEPEGRSRITGGTRSIHCAECKKRMEKVDATTLELNLNKPERVARQLGSVRFEGWKCPPCSQQLRGLGFHIIAYVSNSQEFGTCPTCQELTVVRRTKTLKVATCSHPGERLIIEDCRCCSYRKEKKETIPRLPPSPPPSSGSFGGGSSGGGTCSGGFSGGSFGGGSSGGGGAGGSF